MRDAVIKSLTQLARDDPKIFLITADLGFGVLSEFSAEFPKHYLNVGVAEQNMMGVATGLALDGRTVFTYSIGNFPTLRCLEQIRNGACYHNANVNIISVGGGLSYGALGYSHHATEDIAIMRALPNITVVAPSDPWEASEAVRALAHSSGPSYLRVDKSAAINSEEKGEVFQLGKIRVIKHGKDLTLMSLGGLLAVSLDIAEALKSDGIECRVLSMHTIKPVDEDAIVDAVNSTGRLVVIEEHVEEGGLCGVISEVCLRRGVMPKKFASFALDRDKLGLVGSQEYLRKRHQLDAHQIIESIKKSFFSR